MKLFTIYLYGLCFVMGVFNAFAIIFGIPQLFRLVAAFLAGGGLLSASSALLGVFINGLLSMVYFMMGFIFLRRETAGTLNMREAVIGWFGLLTLFGMNLIGAKLITSMLETISAGPFSP